MKGFILVNLDLGIVLSFGFFKMENLETMEKRELEQELSSLLEVTLKLEDELNYMTMHQN